MVSPTTPRESQEEGRLSAFGGWHVSTQGLDRSEDPVARGIEQEISKLPLPRHGPEVKVFYILAFGIPSRRTDDFEDWLTRLAAEYCLLAIVDMVGTPQDDGRYPENFISATVRRDYLKRLEDGVHSFVLASPPRSTCGPPRVGRGAPPVRSRRRPWGFPNLTSGALRNQLLVENRILLFLLDLLAVASGKKIAWASEHPAPRRGDSGLRFGFSTKFLPSRNLPVLVDTLSTNVGWEVLRTGPP